MKKVYSLLIVLACTFVGFAQNGVYVKYETKIDATGEDAEMMAMMMNGTTMELAISEKKTWVKTQMGTMMTMTMQMDVDNHEMTMFMTGMMGNMAFQGDPDELNNGEEVEEEEADIDLQLLDETKVILGYICKKAIITDADGNQAIYWYTEKIERPDEVSQMPNQIPGLCLEFETMAQEGVSMKYTATEASEKVDMDDYEIVIPEGTEIKSLSEMSSMGM